MLVTVLLVFKPSYVYDLAVQVVVMATDDILYRIF